MRTAIFFTLSFLFSFLPAQGLVLSGTVTDATTGEPLAGATVRLDGTLYGLHTSPAGEYRFTRLKPGNYTVVVTLLGYETVREDREITSDTKLDIRLKERQLVTEEVVITTVRSTDYSPVANTTLKREDLQKSNLGQDLPMLLNMTPSVVVNSDAGAGVGYTGMRIRGSDPTRVNVTLNGIPFNDAESHYTYFVDLPDFASSAEDIQIQRGVGSSTNGSGAFGASVNIRTDDLQTDAFAQTSNSFGSFRTMKNNIRFGTGLLSPNPERKNKFAFSGRLSRIVSDGYIDRASSNLKSWFLSGGWFTGKSMLKLNVFSGKEKTYQAWYGVPQDSLATNRRMNEKTYDDETDNYTQTHYQLLWSTDISRTNLQASLHYTRGNGYYEQYRTGESFSDYGWDTLFTPNDTITSTDLIRRLWLDNHFFGGTVALRHGFSGVPLHLTVSASANQYRGKHYGEVIWARYAGNREIRDRYYENDAVKSEGNVFAKLKWIPSARWDVYADLQVRTVGYSFLGYNSLLQNVTQTAAWTFFNPKAGVVFEPKQGTSVYASLGVANREPNRDDLTQSTPERRPKPETLYDGEAGFRHSRKNYQLAANLFCMYYHNQLVLTGELNNVGAYTRTNIGTSYRAGIEMEGAVRILPTLQAAANLTLSRNKILTFPEYIDDYDNGGQILNQWKNTDISFSPSIISAMKLSWTPLKSLEATLTGKYVSRQYLDNTSARSRSLDPFFVSDFICNWTLHPRFVKEVRLQLMVNNLFSARYCPNGYTYSYVWGGSLQTFNYYYPQATRNFLAGVTLGF